MKNINLMDVKQALRDAEFRKSLPPDFTPDVQKYLGNPGCGCNTGLYKKILTDCKTQLEQYFPDKKLSDPTEELKKLAENHWLVISCHISELEEELKKLPPGRKQVAITRFEEQVTVVINELDILY